MLAQRLQAKPEPHEDPLLCGRLLQQEAAIFSQSPSTPPGCYVGYGEREFQRQLSASRLLLCFFWSCVSKFNGNLYSHCPCRTSQPCSIDQIFLTKWQPPIWLGYEAKQEFFMRLQLRLQSLAQAWFYIKSIVVLLLIKHNNTSTSVCPSPLTFSKAFGDMGQVLTRIILHFTEPQNYLKTKLALFAV